MEIGAGQYVWICFTSAGTGNPKSEKVVPTEEIATKFMQEGTDRAIRKVPFMRE